jgi:putative addiction module component (TIGR02574 family)
MPLTMKSLGLEQARVEDKLELVEEIWDSIAADPQNLPLPASHWAELERRLTPPDGPNESWEDVKREIESEL